MQLTSMNLGQLAEDWALRFGESVMVEEVETDRRTTYRRFNHDVNRFAHGLKARGVHAGDYVGIMLDNCLEYLVASYALKKLGAIEVSMNCNFRGPALVRMLNLTGLTTLVTEAKFADPIADVRREIDTLSHIISLDGFRSDLGFDVTLFGDVYSERTDNCAREDDQTQVCLILFTSGTTGVSKGCELPHRSSIRAAESMIEAFALTSDDAVYSPYPLFHCAAAQYDCLAAWMVGGRAILRKGFSRRNFWADVNKHHASWFMLLGSVMQLLWSNEVTDDERTHRMRFMWGTPLPINHDEWEQRFNLRLARGGGYGSTDAGSVALPLWDKTGAGKVLPRYEVAIFDTEDQPLPAGQAGELVIREVEPGVMATGYLGQPDVTAETWRDGWFRTGDLCRLDEVGDVYWLSRLKERIRVKGEMVSAYEIEEVVLNHPAVADCGVLGLPDGTGEETIHVAAELKDGVDSLVLEDLVAFCAGKMSKFMIPTSLSLHAPLPKTPSGKVAKAELSQRMFESQR